MAPVIFLALHRHSVGACVVQGGAPMDPERVLHAHLDIALRGLQVPAAPTPATARPAGTAP